jgi:hypothetical protein
VAFLLNFAEGLDAKATETLKKLSALGDAIISLTVSDQLIKAC